MEASVPQLDRFVTRPMDRHRKRRSAKLECLLALGIVLSGASQFRVAGLPVGPGEACLMVWAGLRALCAILRPGPLGRRGGVILCFWAVFAIAQCVGLIKSLSAGIPIDWVLTLHDVTAYVLMAVISSFCLTGDERDDSLSHVTRYLMTFASLSLVLQIAAGWGFAPAPGTGPWYWDRFRGWADNPNQLSMFCAIAVAIAVYVIETAERRRDRFAASICASLAFAAGFLTRGNTMRLSLAIGACVFASLLIRNIASRRGRPARSSTLGVLLVAASTPLLALALVPYASQLSAEDLAQQVSRDQGETLNEANLRFTLWAGASQGALDSFFLGMGPGPHAPVPLDLTLRRVWEVDSFEESLGAVAKHADVMESHNTYIELFSQGGLLIVLAFAGLLMCALRGALRSRSAALPGMLCVLVVFGIFHVMLRHPIVWLALCLCVGARSSFVRSVRGTVRQH